MCLHDIGATTRTDKGAVKVDAGNTSVVTVKDAEALASMRIPDAQRSVPAGRHDQVLAETAPNAKFPPFRCEFVAAFLQLNWRPATTPI